MTFPPGQSHPSNQFTQSTHLQNVADFHANRAVANQRPPPSNQLTSAQQAVIQQQRQLALQLQAHQAAVQQQLRPAVQQGSNRPPNSSAPAPHESQSSLHPALLPGAHIPASAPSPPRPANAARRDSIPVTQAFRPTPQALLKIEQDARAAAAAKAKPKPNLKLPPQPPVFSRGPSVQYLPRPDQLASQRSPAQLTEYRPMRDGPQMEVQEIRKRRDDGMRGSMRGEISRLMYAAGDVVEPDIDSVDYMEDLVVDFLADLCRPVAPIRANQHSILQSVPLTAPIIRHRLSHPTLKKYADRFDHMLYMSTELATSRRVAAPNNHDLIELAGKAYLGLDEPASPDKKTRKKKGVGADGKELTGPKEKVKPGPKKGWKREREEKGISGDVAKKAKGVKRVKKEGSVSGA
ncbi:hypothetical protein P7C73_g1614, partial [Tremellales sp. Uapishka_1]